jgi:hypothetical protein
MIGWRKIANGRASCIERLAAAKHGVEHLQRSAARGDTLKAWHDASQCSS